MRGTVFVPGPKMVGGLTKRLKSDVEKAAVDLGAAVTKLSFSVTEVGNRQVVGDIKPFVSVAYRLGQDGLSSRHVGYSWRPYGVDSHEGVSELARQVLTELGLTEKLE